MNLSEQMGEDSDIQPYALTPFLEPIIQGLLQTTERTDGDESNLRSAAYDTLSSLVQNCAPVIDFFFFFFSFFTHLYFFYWNRRASL